jgi:hypothetical protein
VTHMLPPPKAEEEEELAPRLAGQDPEARDTGQHKSADVSRRQRLLAGASSSPARLLGGGSSQALSELAASLVFARTVQRLQNVTESAKRLGMLQGAPPGFAHALILVLRKLIRCAPSGAFVRHAAEHCPRNAAEESASANSNWFEEIRRALRFTLDAVEVALGQLGAKFTCFTCAKVRTLTGGERAAGGTQCTCFTCTKVQILTGTAATRRRLRVLYMYIIHIYIYIYIHIYYMHTTRRRVRVFRGYG